MKPSTAKYHRPELICPAGTPASLRTAVDAGADAVYCGFQNQTNARNFAGLNFTPDELAESVQYAHERGTKVLLTINSYPEAGKTELWKNAVDTGAALGIDAFIVADIGICDYISKKYPEKRIHLSVQAAASSPEAIKFYCRDFGVKRIVLPRILTIQEIKKMIDEVPCEVETFIFGNHGLMVEGRCSLSAYATGLSTNTDGVCSPAHFVEYTENDKGDTLSKLGGYTVDCFSLHEKAGYPTLCKGRYLAEVKDGGKEAYYAFEEPVSLNLSMMLPELMEAGVSALKIEGRQRSRAYVMKVVSAFRKNIDAIMEGREPQLADLLELTEGNKQTEGAFKTKRWR